MYVALKQTQDFLCCGQLCQFSQSYNSHAGQDCACPHTTPTLHCPQVGSCCTDPRIPSRYSHSAGLEEPWRLIFLLAQESGDLLEFSLRGKA